MIGPRSGRGRLAVLAALALLAGGAALLAASVLTTPRTVSSAVLGARWQCSDFILMTVCTQGETIAPVAEGPVGPPDDVKAADDATAAICTAPPRDGARERRSIKFETLR
jgi:hypothetical protein